DCAVHAGDSVECRYQPKHPPQHAAGPGSDDLRPQTWKRATHSGNVRTRWPVAAKIALQIAGATGGNAGSPTPVGGESLLVKCTSPTGASRTRVTRHRL